MAILNQQTAPPNRELLKMLACGQVCQPKEISREIQLFQSSTRVAWVDTDAGEGFVKGLGNPQGVSALISELVCAELGSWFGLSIPPFAVIPTCSIEIKMIDRHEAIQPPLFFSKKVEGTQRDGSNVFLKRLRKSGDVARLVVFDTWVRNADRYLDGQSNSDNLIYSPVPKSRKFDLVPIDHSHCFVAGEFDDELPGNELVKDQSVYGLFPEFRQHLSCETISLAIDHLSSLERSFVEEGLCLSVRCDQHVVGDGF